MARHINWKILLISLFIINGTLSSFAQTTKRELLLGKWAFDKFDFSGEMDFVPVERRNADNKKNQGLMITFFADNKFQSIQKGGLQDNNGRGSYKLFGDSSLIMGGDTSKISKLDKDLLRLYHKGRPVAVFKRIE